MEQNYNGWTLQEIRKMAEGLGWRGEFFLLVINDLEAKDKRIAELERPLQAIADSCRCDMSWPEWICKLCWIKNHKKFNNPNLTGNGKLEYGRTD